MSLVVSAVIVVAFCFAFRRLIKSYPAVFYVLAVLVAAFGIYFTLNTSPSPLVRSMAFAIQKGHVGFSMLALVMFVGVFGDQSSIRRALAPVRGELSIMGSILIAGHFVPYIASYFSMLGALFSLKPTVAASCLIAIVLLCLLAVLFVTSFTYAKKRMNAHTWKCVQMLAYPFFGLVFLHLLGFFLVPLLAGSSKAAVSCGIYAAVLVLYIALRVRRYMIDAHRERMIAN